MDSLNNIRISIIVLTDDKVNAFNSQIQSIIFFLSTNK